jgi:hypothetical protein
MVDEQDQIRPHMRVFVNGEQIRDLNLSLAPADDVQIIQSLSAG